MFMLSKQYSGLLAWLRGQPTRHWKYGKLIDRNRGRQSNKQSIAEGQRSIRYRGAGKFVV